MSTGIESWNNLSGIDAMYPFVGTEVTLSIIGFVVWIGWHIWQMKHENSSYEDQNSKLKDNLSKAISGD